MANDAGKDRLIGDRRPGNARETSAYKVELLFAACLLGHEHLVVLIYGVALVVVAVAIPDIEYLDPEDHEEKAG